MVHKSMLFSKAIDHLFSALGTDTSKAYKYKLEKY
jgi:hypothetical protein